MNLSRRYQAHPPYAYCTVCNWPFTGSDRAVTVEQKARAHAVVYGYETGLVRPGEQDQRTGTS